MSVEDLELLTATYNLANKVTLSYMRPSTISLEARYTRACVSHFPWLFDHFPYHSYCIHLQYILWTIYLPPSIYCHPSLNPAVISISFLAFSIPRSRTVVGPLPQSIPIPIYQPYPPTIGLLIINYLFLQSMGGCAGERRGGGEAYYHKPNLKHYKLYIRFYMVSNPVKNILMITTVVIGHYCHFRSLSA